MAAWVAVWAVVVTLLLCSECQGQQQHGVSVQLFRNTISSGVPAASTVIPTLQFSVTLPGPSSADVRGTWIVAPNTAYVFDCEFDNSTTVLVWVDDHLVCQNIFDNPTASYDGSPDTPLQVMSKLELPIRAQLVNPNQGNNVPLALTLRARLATQTSFNVLPTETLRPTLSDEEERRSDLQRRLAVGWGTWLHHSLLSLVLLPDSAVLNVGICQLSTQTCKTDAQIENTDATLRVGPFALDRSYAQFYLAWQQVNVSIEFGVQGDRDVSVLVTPQNCATTNCSDYAVVLLGRFAWNRVGAVTPVQSSSLVYQPYGLGSSTAYMTAQSKTTSLPLPENITSQPYLAALLDRGAVAVNTGLQQSIPDTTQQLLRARYIELKTYQNYGSLAGEKEAMQAAIMWNLIYTPAEAGPLMPVSRSWNFAAISQETADWSYVIFDWDNIFASYIASLDAREIAYSNLIQVIRAKTAKGFVPNYSAGGLKSQDRTEPPVGSRVLLEIYKRYKDTWLVRLLFDDLLDWHNWFYQTRILAPLGMICLGSNIVPNNPDGSIDTMQGARYESGLDNSPMYDGEFFNTVTQQMQLYDVGMSSMVVADAEALAELADVIERPLEAIMLRARAALMRKQIATNLWDSNLFTFTNLFTNGTLYPRISPTSFYALMADASTDEQADVMTTEWLLNPQRFCVSKDWPLGNSDDCYWGLPSINAQDPAFPPLGYWRGYVWGPMAQLTYWSLQRYDRVPSVRTGRKALCTQMKAMGMNMWNANRHICENFNPHKNATECTGTKFYHWGALTLLINFIEEGYYTYL